MVSILFILNYCSISNTPIDHKFSNPVALLLPYYYTICANEMSFTDIVYIYFVKTLTHSTHDYKFRIVRYKLFKQKATTLLLNLYRQ